MFSSCSLLLACKVDSVTLNVGKTFTEAEEDGLTSIDIPVGETGYFYATCEVNENPDELDIKWQFDRDGNGAWDGITYYTDFDDLDVRTSRTYSIAGCYDDLKVRACLDDGEDNWTELPEADYCDVDSIEVAKVVKDGTTDEGPIYVCPNGTVDLEAVPDPGSTFPAGEPTWEITSYPAGTPQP